MTVLDYYRFASLATAAYIRAGLLNPSDPDYQSKFSALARDQGRLPLSIAEKLFVQSATNPDVWTVAYYSGGDFPGFTDQTGFAATLFRNRVKGVKGKGGQAWYIA